MLGFMPGVAEMSVIMIVLIVMAIMLIPTIFYLLTLQKTLMRCSPESRTLSPGLVWLQLVPFLNIIWAFILVINISKSLDNEFNRRGIAHEPNPGYNIGMAMAVCSILPIVPFLGFIAGPAALVCWIIYWVKIAEYSAMIAQPGPMEQGYAQSEL